MYDISMVSKRYFEIKLSAMVERIVNGVETEELVQVELKVEPPKLKTLKKVTSLSKVRSEDAMDDLTNAVVLILNKNKTGYKVPEDLIDELDFDQLNGILTSYFEWVGKERNSKTKDPLL